MSTDVKNDFIHHMLTLDAHGLERQLRAILSCATIDENADNLPFYKEQADVLSAIGRFKFGEGLGLDQ